jgi:hypothetical protein
MPFAVSAKDAMLDSLTLDRIRLHSGAPGAAGTDNALGAGLSVAAFDASSSASRALSSNVTVTGLAANQSVTFFSVWTNSGTVFRGSGAITAGDVTANAAGEFILTTATVVNLTDPA